MNKIIIAVVTAAIGIFSVSAAATNLTKEEHQAVEAAIVAEHEADKESCNSSSGDVRKNCLDKAEIKKKNAMEQLESDGNTLGKDLFNADVSKAVAEYSIDKDKCNQMTGSKKDFCLREASAKQINAISAAKKKLKADTEVKEEVEKSSQGTADAN
ncbi:MAG: hypothetical protein IT488_10390 [Gammaproteobacteria bacterium]|nr:hypothetical protein [Gammaproteobacteria bacterium]